MEKTVGVLGLGRLGISFSLLCANNGYKVYGYDVNKERSESIKNKTLKTSEPFIEQLLAKNTINICNSVGEVFEHTDLVFVLVATPSLPNGEYDHSSIDNIVKEIKLSAIHQKTLVISATVMPMYCQSLQNKLSYLGIEVVYNPSFIAQGSIVSNLMHSDIVLVGGNPTNEFYQLHTDIHAGYPNFRNLTLTSAEIAKIGINCFLTVKISFANMLGEIAISSGEEDSVIPLLQTIGSDSRIGTKFLNYGFGYEGVCLPRDNRALGIHAKKVGIQPTIPQTIDNFNQSHYQFLLKKFLKDNPDKSKPVCIDQLSYKKGVDILTESQHYQLCKDLLKEGYIVEIEESETVVDLVKNELEKYGEKVIFVNQTVNG